MAEKAEQLINFREYAAILRHSWAVIVTFAVAGLGAAFVVTQLKTPVYESSVELVLEQPSKANPVTSEMTPFNPWDDTFIHTQKRIIQSDLLRLRAADILLGAHSVAEGSEASEAEAGDTDPKPSAGVVGRALSRLRRRPAPADVAAHIRGKDRPRIAGELGSLSIRSLPRSRILTIQTRSPSPAFAADGANAIAEAYRSFVSERFASSAEQMFLRLQAQAEDSRNRIKELDEAIVDFKKKSEIGLMTARIKADVKGEALATVKQRLAAGSPEIAALEDQLLRADQDLAALAARYKAKHPDMKKLQARRALLQQQIEELKNRAYLQWERKYMQERNEIEFSMLQQDLDATRRVHELLLSKMREIDLSKGAPHAAVRILRAAAVAAVPSYPRTSANLLLGAVTGLLVGLGVAFMRAYSRSGLVTLSISDELGTAPVIGRLPHIGDPASLEALLTQKDSSSPASEAFRLLRTAVESKLKPGPNVILITSPDRGDGKSTVCVALAQSFAKLHRDILLVDVDLRRGELHKVLNVDHDNGLTEFLSRDTDMAGVQNIGNLAFLPRGRKTDNPAEMLGSPRMEEFIHRMSGVYDIILLDSPPLLPVTDASLLARFADLRLLVARSQKTHAAAFKMAANMLHGLGHDIDGVILNDVKAQESSYYGGYYHRYYYRSYGDGAQEKKRTRSRKK